MNRLSEVKVGAVVIIAILLFGVLIYYLLGPGRLGKTYTVEVLFNDARGLSGGEPVRMAGVQIGEVREVSLAANSKASVKLGIQEDVRLYRGYLFTVATGALVAEKFVNVEQVAPTEAEMQIKPDETIIGVETPGLQELIVSAQAVLTRLQEVGASVNNIIGDPEVVKATKTAMMNFETLTHDAAILMANLSRLSERNSEDIARAIENLALASEEAKNTTEYLSKRIQNSNSLDDIEASLKALREASERASLLTGALNAILSQPGLQENIGDSIENMKVISENIKDATANIRDITGDIKEETPRIKRTLENADLLMQDAKSLKDSLKPPQVKPDFSFRASSQAHRSFTDANFDFSFRGDQNNFLRLGAVDIGEQNQFNLQAGKRLSNYDLRYGLVRSKLGFGVDYPMTSQDELSLDILDPNRLRADITATHNLGSEEDGWGLIYGIRDALGDNQGFIGARMGK